ncbi:MAG TPA: hypothetical protein VMT57_09910 [Candidatus Thermoplasmatota archaeon]|nr:hypothetical protein [Candidatus Thermoplasmatota archaeon]
MKLKALLCFVSFIALVFPVSAQEPSPLYWKSVKFVTVEQGQTSYYRYDDYKFLGADVLIRDQHIWKGFWALHTDGMQPQPELPYINFYEDMVIVTLLGYQNTGGPNIEVLGVDIDRNRTLHVLIEDNTQPGLLTVITNPFHIIKVKRFAVHSIVFEHQKR